MNNHPITVSAEQGERVQAGEPFVVDGEWPTCPDDTDGDGDCAACVRRPEAHGPRTAPTAWREADKPCPFCEAGFVDTMRGDLTGECVGCYGTGRTAVELVYSCRNSQCHMVHSRGLFTVSVEPDDDGQFIIKATKVTP